MNGRSCALVVSLLVAATAHAADDQKPKLIVLEFAAAGGADPSLAKTLSEAVTTEVSRRGFYEVLSANDVQTLIGVQRQKELLGCSEEAQSCLSELAGALGAQFVLSGSLSKFGAMYQLNLQTLDSAKAQPIGRSTRLAPAIEVLRGEVPIAVAEATGTPLPPPPSRVLSYSFIGLGAAAVLAGGGLGVYATSNDAALARELRTGEQARTVLQPASTYQSQIDAISTQRTIALAAMVGGAALIATGVVLIPSTTIATDTQVALVPTSSGIALVGVTR